MTRTEELAYWITEREQMRLRKEKYAPYGAGHGFGYSKDRHMGTVRYCNVRREDDKVTQWLAEHWRPQHHAVWEIVLARMVNYIPTLEELVTPFGGSPGHAAIMMGPVVIGNTLKTRRQRGDKVFTSAYTISTCGQSMDKIDYVMGVVAECRETGELTAPTLAEAHRQLLAVNGLGSFLAAQVVADLKNTKEHPLASAEDWWTWSAPGPGSLKGLCAYFNTSITPSSYACAIDECWGEVKPLLSEELQYLHMQDFQNCLCEFSKYIRVMEGGHARNKYAPS
jgi:hypothetical protein